MPSVIPLAAPGWAVPARTGADPQTTRLPTTVLPPAVAITADVHVELFDVTDGASGPHVGSPMISTVYWAKSDAVIESQVLPLTTVTLKPKFVAIVCSTLGLPLIVSPLINAVPDCAEAG